MQGQGEQGGIKLNKEDYFLFPDFIQEQCNRWFFHLPGELGRREERAEGAGRGGGPGHEELTPPLNVRHEEPGGLHHPCGEKPWGEGQVPTAQGERAEESQRVVFCYVGARVPLPASSHLGLPP